MSVCVSVKSLLLMRVLKNVKFRQGAYGAHMAEETTPLPLVFLKSVISKNMIFVLVDFLSEKLSFWITD